MSRSGPEKAGVIPEKFDAALLPAPFGLNNTGSICFFNALLQALASQTSFVKTVLERRGYMSRTRTGAALLAFVEAFAGPPPPEGVADHSRRVLAALMEDLARRRPHVRFGATQESASEAIVHLLDMLEAEPEGGADGGGAPRAETVAFEAQHPTDPKESLSFATSVQSPLTRLFLHRFRCDMWCTECRKCVSVRTDTSTQFNMFHLDEGAGALRSNPSTPSAFVQALRRHLTLVDDYSCDNCKKKCKAYRVYRLTMVPETIVCLFNIYGTRPSYRYVPLEISFDSADGGGLDYALTATIEHSGSLHGGHYVARALRRDSAGDEPRSYMFNDAAAPSPCTLAGTPNTYIVVYHFKGETPPKNKDG